MAEEPLGTSTTPLGPKTPDPQNQPVSAMPVVQTPTTAAAAAPLPAIQPVVPKTEQQDVSMPDAAPSPAAPQQLSAVSTPIAPRNATPVRNLNGVVETMPLPLKAAPHGAPARRYLNEKVTGVLLEGMKRLAVEQPDDPLRVLGEYLLQRSRELEGAQVGG